MIIHLLFNYIKRYSKNAAYQYDKIKGTLLILASSLHDSEVHNYVHMKTLYSKKSHSFLVAVASAIVQHFLRE